MRRIIPLLTITTLFSAFLFAQSDRYAYAVTDVNKDNNWSFLRKLDLRTGAFSDVLLNGTDLNTTVFDVTSKKPITTPVDSRFGQSANAPFATGVAAAAYDKKNNRLYYTPMFIDQLRYIDLKTMKVYFVADKAFTGMTTKSPDQGNIITRMVIASDGNGYAMTNDGRHLVQFGLGKKTDMVDLGSLIDDPANKNGISVHNSCSSFGGDMIADDNGNIFVFSARNNVFKVNIESRVASHLGTVKGLPANFTINGAVVNEKNQILVASAVEAASYFTVDPETWTATAFAIPGNVWHSSDLANGNFLSTKPKLNNSAPNIEIARPSPGLGSEKVQVYPNPVTNNKFYLQFGNLEAGKYTISVTDVTGREVVQLPVTINSEVLTQQVDLTNSAARGVYLVKVMNGMNIAVYSSKIIVQ